MVWIVVGALFGLFGLFGLFMPLPDKGLPLYVASVVLVAMSAYLIVGGIKKRTRDKARKADAPKAKPAISGVFPLMEGLPLAEYAACALRATEEGLEIRSSEQSFLIPIGQILEADVSEGLPSRGIQADEEQVSAAGAMLGGDDKKELRRARYFLKITCDGENGPRFLAFEATNDIEAAVRLSEALREGAASANGR